MHYFLASINNCWKLCLLIFVANVIITSYITIEIFHQTDLGPKPYDCLWPRLFPLPRPGLMFVTSANCSKRLRCCRNSGSSLRFILTGASGILSFQHPVIAKKQRSLKYSLRIEKNPREWCTIIVIVATIYWTRWRFIETWEKVKQENGWINLR